MQTVVYIVSEKENSVRTTVCMQSEKRNRAQTTVRGLSEKENCLQTVVCILSEKENTMRTVFRVECAVSIYMCGGGGNERHARTSYLLSAWPGEGLYIREDYEKEALCIGVTIDDALRICE